ncbi:branched-chain amino acid ABC transporter permease [Roseisalinus antarcticus]|uniref:Leucine/isoleucine/valine transporter permease subunit n=1 Tax=Roseisalinus antarcticus TaxID=254357 RepID=A0A1Y5TH33_9RHOB|nr:branched-chain amino acid ABC transporter permease [Roseisalinus antarcticus]SLN64068.1 leucine/isoleucine/valine transporter permease subunit [Roseisalinus antarcticus]
MAMSDFQSSIDASIARNRGRRPWIERVPPAYWVLAILLLVMPGFASNFVLYQIFGWTFILGIIASSLMFLAGYGGMVSLAQMTFAGVAGYMVAIFGDSAIDTISQGWPWYITIPLALLVAVLFATIVGWLAVRTAGIYTIMITLAVAAAFFYFARQNYEVFNGFTGFQSVSPPQLFGVDWQDAVPFYYLTLFWAVAAYFSVLYLSRAPFGLALQGVRDNPRRMGALGYNVTAHRVAAYSFSAILAGIGGILLAWQSGQISPGTVSIQPSIDILVIAVVGGIRHPIGAFIGAFLYVLLKTFAVDVLISLGLDGDRFNLLIGMGFLLVVFFSPDGLLGLWEKAKDRSRRDPLTGRPRE